MLTHLLIMRHAKSSWDNEELSDHERGLNARGRKSADAIARVLSAKNIAPDVIWSSDAQRTRETAERMIRIIPGAQNIFFNSEFYMASAEHVLELCQSAEEPNGRLLLLGHNPGWSILFEYFSGHAHRYPTGACGIFVRKNNKSDWLSPDAWQFKELLLPRDILGE